MKCVIYKSLYCLFYLHNNLITDPWNNGKIIDKQKEASIALDKPLKLYYKLTCHQTQPHLRGFINVNMYVFDMQANV